MFVYVQNLCYICVTKREKMENNLTKKIYESPNRESNFEKYGHLSEQCICCGKPMKEGEKLYIHMNVLGLAVNPSISENDFVELTGATSQGCFPIGNDCAKKMKGFTFNM